MQKTKVIKVVKLTLSVVWWIVLVLLALLLVNILGAKLRGEVPKVFGYSVMHIISNSMGETIPEGSYILIKETDPEDIKKDDIICFLSDDPTIYGFPNTHRVVEDPIFTDIGIEFVTRGDANHGNDTVTAKSDRLVGRYVKTMGGLKSFSDMLDSGGLIAIMGVLLVAMSIIFLYSWLIKLKEETGSATTNSDKNGQNVKISLEKDKESEQNREDISTMIKRLEADGVDINAMVEELSRKGINIKSDSPEE